MVNDYKIEDLEIINQLGEEINKDFKKLFHIENINLNERIYTYKINHIVVGFIHIYEGMDNIDILNLIVDKKYRKQNIATKLLEHIIKTYNKNILLEVRDRKSVV